MIIDSIRSCIILGFDIAVVIVSFGASFIALMFLLCILGTVGVAIINRITDLLKGKKK